MIEITVISASDSASIRTNLIYFAAELEVLATCRLKSFESAFSGKMTARFFALMAVLGALNQGDTADCSKKITLNLAVKLFS